MRKVLIATMGLLAISAQQASATAILHLNSGSQSYAGSNLSHITSNNLITPGEADSYTTMTNATFNAMSPGDLAATYDVIVAPWYVNPDANMDWVTRMEPYLAAGGSVLWEDPYNIGDIAASGVSLLSGNAYTADSSTIVLTSPFGDAGAEGYFHIHFSITGHDGTWSVFSEDGDDGIHGVNKEFAGGGRMVIGVSDNLYHPNFLNAGEADHMNLTINELNWLVSGSITGIPTDPDSVPAPAPLLLIGFGLMGLGAARRGRSA